MLTLPFGSFTPEQPAAVIDLKLAISERADPGQALQVSVRGGYAFGTDPLDNPLIDVPVHAATGSDLSITPQAFTVRSALIAPEGETATGPNFVRHADVTITPAPGTTLSDDTRFHLTLPDGLVYVGAETGFEDSLAAQGWAVEERPVYDGDTDNDTLVLYRLDGQPISSAQTLTVPFYVTEKFQDGSDVVAAGTGAATAIAFAADAIRITDGQWQGVAGSNIGGGAGDTDDVLPVAVTATLAPLTARSVQVIKDSIYRGGSRLGAGATVVPGDVLEYHLQVDVSDFFRLGAVTVTDDLPDGLVVDASFTPTLQVDWRDQAGADQSTSLAFDASTFEFTGDPATGKTTLQFRLSERLDAVTPKQLLGGLVTASGETDGVANTWTPGNAGTGGTRATIVFRATVAENYATDQPLDPAIEHRNLKQRDPLDNTAAVAVDVLDRATGDDIADQADESGESVSLPAGQLALTIATVNGVAFTPDTVLSPGDRVTYRLVYDLPIGDYEALSFDTYLPLPVYQLTPGAFALDTDGGSLPEVDQWSVGPANTASTTGDPWSVEAGANNRLSFSLGSSGPVASSAPTQVELYFTVEVTDQPFADRLLLTTQGQQTDSSSTARRHRHHDPDQSGGPGSGRCPRLQGLHAGRPHPDRRGR
ncbi:MAG: hypothetical protein WCY32_10880 [Burkholderiaceae bacterium]